jgi:hypothetical protein
MNNFSMKRIYKPLGAASVEPRAVQACSWLKARSPKRLPRKIAWILAVCASAPMMAEEPEGTLKVDVKLVNVFVTVTDAHGAPVPSLQKENFLLKEDGSEQKIAIFAKESALPLSIVLAVDTSLSTRKDLPLELISAR